MNVTEPVRAFHLRFGSHDLVDSFKKFIEKVLVPKGINHLVLECNTSFVFESHPEVTGGTLTKQDAREIAAVCKNKGIRLIPLFQCLGHQGWGGAPNSILKAHPEFDETPHVPFDAKWPDIFCRSWCPEHPDVNQFIFELMDELIDAFRADAFHVGMDEVFVLADDQCPRCQGKDRADLFAKVVNDLHKHLVKERGVEMFMWGDRLNDSAKLGYDQWEGDTFGTHKAIDLIPKDIVMMDWHYEKLDEYPSIRNFIEKGFTVIPACWFKTNAAIDFFNESKRQAQEQGSEDKMPGMVVTSWNSWDKESFERFMTMSPNSFECDEKLEELDELYRTMSVIVEKLNSRF
ncbi:family 20 glycosylhydrolase [Metabacillus bambusae]|uniref:Family 20 glycosylhydrolase n=1 Tax=Metabacillus bambusae TaxID=2795218 RepID=A0ABS3N3P4_9BACI|nr:family 20 glycosylhydrolase [Metabacillus bambusae]MBO1512765.1 family 20 glycosylhydrolase [Metabacillus bambusae]